MNLVWRQRHLRAARQPGFTLLEAVIALAILAGVAIICLQVRAQAITRGRKMEDLRRADEQARMILEMAVSGLLPGGVGPVAGDPARKVTWQGTHAGAEYVCVREAVRMQNPAAASIAGGDASLAQLVELNKYSVTFGKGEAEVYVAGSQ